MATDLSGTFVISWMQTELDGRRQAPLSAMRAGAAWRWTGEAVRVDGAQGILRLGDAIGMAEMRRRAARQVQRLTGAAVPTRPHDEGVADDAAGFTVTDGTRSWAAAVIGRGAGRPALIAVEGGMPPADTELWIVRSDAAVAEPRGEPPGGVICFTPGTMILTGDGPRPVEDLREGCAIQTKDDGLAELIWTGSRRLTGARLHAMPDLAPVRVGADALGQGVPDAALTVSPDHRIVLRGPRARALFNEHEVLVAARDLAGRPGVRTLRGLREVTYIHLLLPAHGIVFANGVETESFHPASADLSRMDAGHVARITELVPGLVNDPFTYGRHARRALKSAEAAILTHAMAA